MSEEKKCICGVPIDENTKCGCNGNLCIYCCDCKDDCKCGCAQKAEAAKADKEGEEENCSCCAHKDCCPSKE